MVEIPDLRDSQVWPVESLLVLRKSVNDEINRRHTITSAESQMDELVRQYSEATGRKDGDPWTQPTGAHDSYPDRSVVTHNGKEWVSTIPGNVWEPGVSGWREYTAPDSGIFPEFLPPTGAHDAYMTGDKVTFRGRTYVSVIDSNVYSPLEYPQGWVEVEEDGAEAPEEGPQDWVAPTGAHDAYNSGDQVTFEGQTYESVVDGNTISPTDYPDGWVVISGETTPEPGGPAEETVPEFVQPTGAHDSYSIGDRVTFEGTVYESAIDNNSYSPSAYPAGWTAV